MCLVLWFLEISPLPHIVQWYGFFQVFILLCTFEWFLDMNFLPHSAQGFRFSSAWRFIVKIEITETPIVFPDFSVFSAYSAGSISFTDSGRSRFIDIHCFFRSITNLNSCSGCSSPLPPPQSSGAVPPPGALVAPANCFRGAVLRYWGGVTSIVLNVFHTCHISSRLRSMPS